MLACKEANWYCLSPCPTASTDVEEEECQSNEKPDAKIMRVQKKGRDHDIFEDEEPRPKPGGALSPLLINGEGVPCQLCGHLFPFTQIMSHQVSSIVLYCSIEWKLIRTPCTFIGISYYRSGYWSGTKSCVSCDFTRGFWLSRVTWMEHDSIP